MKLYLRLSALLIALAIILSLLVGCVPSGEPEGEGTGDLGSLEIEGEESISIGLGGVRVLEIKEAYSVTSRVQWSVIGEAVTVDEYGFVKSVGVGTATVTARYGDLSDSVRITVTGEPDEYSDPYTDVDKSEFYGDYTPAEDFIDAYYRTQHYLLSGENGTQAKEPTVANNRPAESGVFIRNSDMCYEDNGNTYVVYEPTGEVAFRIYRGAAYVTLEEIAAYMFAFGGTDGAFPANYTSVKKPNPAQSPWGEYLRANHSFFIGDTERYPREPELPNISGCGGKLQYWEMDIGTHTYNNGNKITRGECRLVYGRRDLSGDGNFGAGELHVFYTYNHYDDFQEYLNYHGGWGERFGYETNGSSSLKGPSPYVDVVFRTLVGR